MRARIWPAVALQSPRARAAAITSVVGRCTCAFRAALCVREAVERGALQAAGGRAHTLRGRLVVEHDDGSARRAPTCQPQELYQHTLEFCPEHMSSSAKRR